MEQLPLFEEPKLGDTVQVIDENDFFYGLKGIVLLLNPQADVYVEFHNDGYKVGRNWYQYFELIVEDS